jgi:hypothetical protein
MALLLSYNILHLLGGIGKPVAFFAKQKGVMARGQSKA